MWAFQTWISFRFLVVILFFIVSLWDKHLIIKIFQCGDFWDTTHVLDHGPNCDEWLIRTTATDYSRAMDPEGESC